MAPDSQQGRLILHRRQLFARHWRRSKFTVSRTTTSPQQRSQHCSREDISYATHKNHNHNCFNINHSTRKSHTCRCQSYRTSEKSPAEINAGHAHWVNFELCRVTTIGHLLCTDCHEDSMGGGGGSRLHDCTSLLSGCPQYLLNKLQKVQNNTAPLVLEARISPHVASLHWLPIDYRIGHTVQTLFSQL